MWELRKDFKFAFSTKTEKRKRWKHFLLLLECKKMQVECQKWPTQKLPEQLGKPPSEEREEEDRKEKSSQRNKKS
jgi:hypothetical protein